MVTGSLFWESRARELRTLVAGYVLLLLLLFGWAVLPFMYIWSFLFTTPSTGFVWITLWNVLAGQSNRTLSFVLVQNVLFFSSFQDNDRRLWLLLCSLYERFEALTRWCHFRCAGIATVMAVIILNIPGLNTKSIAKALEWLFLILIPNYCLGQGLEDLYNNFQYLNICTRADVQIICDLTNMTLGCCKGEWNWESD